MHPFHHPMPHNTDSFRGARRCADIFLATTAGAHWTMIVTSKFFTGVSLRMSRKQSLSSIHDLELAAIALQDVRFPDGRPPPEGSDSEGRPRAGSKHSHCWAYIQNLCRVENCPYLHPVQAHYCACYDFANFVPFPTAILVVIRHTPCLQWPNCNKGALCPYKHPEPIIPKVRTLPPLIEQPSMTAKPASPVERTLGGAVQYHGTTYFPLKPQFTPSPPAPAAPAPSTQIYEPQRRHESVARMGFAPYLSPPPWQQQMPPISPQIQYSTSYSSVSSMETPNFALDGPRFPPPVPPSFGLQPRTPPFYDGVIYSGRPPPQPAQPMHDSFQQMHRRVASIPRSTVPVPSSIMEQFQNMSVAEQPQTEQQEPFPYVPPTAQRPGHARRVSVALRSKEDTDALGLFSSAPARQPWQTHGTRSAHRVRLLARYSPSLTSLTHSLHFHRAGRRHRAHHQ